MQKTGILIGATGLLGSALLTFLLEDENYEKIKIFVRKASKIQHQKIEEIIIQDFEEIDNYKDFIKGDILFSCLGTTLKKAKSKEKFAKIEVEYPIQFAQIAKENNCQNFVFVSVNKANIDSSNLFKKTKAKLEEELKKLNISNLQILRPSFIIGDRNEVRANEDLWRVLNAAFPMFVPSSKKTIRVNTVAKFMQLVALKEGIQVYETKKIRRIERKTFDMHSMKEETKYREV